MKTKIIFLAFVLFTGLGCFAQEDYSTLRDDDLPYDSLADLADYSSNNDESYDLSNADNVEPNNENVELPNSATYVGRVYYFDTWNHLVYRIDVIVDRPNFIRYYYSIDGYNYIYYPYASPIVYDSWWSWSLVRYSSWGSFCHSYPYFNRRVNHYCHSLNFGNGEYGQSRNIRDYYHGRRGNNYNYSGGNNTRYDNGGNNNGGFNNNAQGRPTTTEGYRQPTQQQQVQRQSTQQSAQRQQPQVQKRQSTQRK